MAGKLNDILESNLRKVQSSVQSDQPMWQIEQAVRLVQELEPRMKKIGAHVGLTGGTLFKGSSKKDLDLIIYPHSTSKPPKLEELETCLFEAGFSNKPEEGSSPEPAPRPSRRISNALDKLWGRIKNKDGDNKIVTVWQDVHGRRIDVFFLDFPDDWFTRAYRDDFKP